MANLRLTSSYIWRPCWFSIFGGLWEYFTILFEILTDANVGIDTKTKSMDSLIRKIFVIEWFHLISVLIRSITQNATDKKLCEILTVENVGIDTKTKYLEILIRNIFVIEWFHLISMLIRSITQNAMDKNVIIRQFPSPEHPYIAFPQKNLAVLDISRFTTEEIGPQSRLNGDIQTMMVEQHNHLGINKTCAFKQFWSHDIYFRLAKRWHSAPDVFKLSNVGPTLAQLRHSDRNNTNRYTTLGQSQHSDHDNRKKVQIQNH